jgi:hypothetical protein
LLFLPRKGKLFNPMELFFAVSKRHLRNTYPFSLAGRERRDRTRHELRASFAEAAAHAVEGDKIAGFFRERGGTRAFSKYHPQDFKTYEEMN